MFGFFARGLVVVARRRSAAQDLQGAGRRARGARADEPVMSAVDPDAVGILCRNLVENALRHGSQSSPVAVVLSGDGILTVANDGPVVPEETLAKLSDRFERNGKPGRGSGIGLSIASTIARRLGSALTLRSPRQDSQSGFEARVGLASAVAPETRI